MKTPILALLVLAVLLVRPALAQSPSKVTIVAVRCPDRVYDRDPFSVQVDLHANQAGGKIKIALIQSGAEPFTSESSLLLDPRGSSVTLTIDNLKLTWNSAGYTFELDAYWEAALGGQTKEDSRTLTIRAIAVTFSTNSEPETAQSNTPFNLTYTIKNQGNDVAHDVTAGLTQLGRFLPGGPANVSLGDIGPGQTRTIVFKLSSGLLDLIEGSRKVELTLAFLDWRGTRHSQVFETSVYLRLSQAALTYWIPWALALLLLIAGIILVARKKVQSVSVGPVSVKGRR